MTSKRWTIVCLTLTLLIFGCSDSELANVKRPTKHGKMETAAALAGATVSESNPADAPATEADASEPQVIPNRFQPPEPKPRTGHPGPSASECERGFGITHPPAIPVGLPRVDRQEALPQLPGLQVMPEVPGHFPGHGNGSSVVDPKGMLGPRRNGARPGLPPDLPGFEPPRLEVAPGTELLRLPQPGAASAATDIKDQSVNLGEMMFVL